jgi:hypothetical protein
MIKNVLIASNTMPELKYKFEDIDEVKEYKDGTFTIQKYGDVIAKFHINSFHFVIHHEKKD